MKNKTMIILLFGVLSICLGTGFVLVPSSEKILFKSSLLASAHLLTLAIGLSGIFLRGIFLRDDLTRLENIKRLFAADTAWGIAAMLWIATGMMRAFGEFEKGYVYYIHNPMFHLKLGLFALIFFLELWPMVTFIRWRRLVTKKKPIDFKWKKTFEKINFVEVILVVLIVFIAGFIARGLFL